MQKAAEKRLSEAISGPAISLLDSSPADLWLRLERLYHSALKQAQGSAAAGDSDNQATLWPTHCSSASMRDLCKS